MSTFDKSASVSLAAVVKCCSCWARGCLLCSRRDIVLFERVVGVSLTTFISSFLPVAGCPHRDEVPRDALCGDACHRGVGLPMGGKHDWETNAWGRGEREEPATDRLFSFLVRRQLRSCLLSSEPSPCVFVVLPSNVLLAHDPAWRWLGWGVLLAMSLLRLVDVGAVLSDVFGRLDALTRPALLCFFSLCNHDFSCRR